MQTLTVEYLVSGSLDGTTPAPEIDIDTASFGSADQIYRVEVDNLGIIDPDLLGAGGSFGARFIPFFFLDGKGAVGDASAVLEVVAIEEGDVAVTEKLIRSLAGESTSYEEGAIVVPQGSALRLDGYTAGAEPIVVRIQIYAIETLKDAACALELSVQAQAAVSACSNKLTVRSLSDLPTPVAGIIQLPDFTIVSPCGEVDLGANILRLGENTVIIGGSALTDRFQTSNPTALISATDGQFFVTQNVSLRNTGGPIIDYNGLGEGLFAPTTTFFDESPSAGTVRDASFVGINNCAFIGNSQGLTFDGQIASLGILGSVFASNQSPTFRAIRVEPTAQIISAVISENAIFLDEAGQIGLSFDPAATYNIPLRVLENNILGSIPPAIALDGVTSDDVRFIFQNNSFIQNTRTVGQMFFEDNRGGEVTNIPGAGTFVPIGNGNASHPVFGASAANSRVTVQPPGPTVASAQTLRYESALTVPQALRVVAFASFQNPAGAAVLPVAIRITQAGVPLSPFMDGTTPPLATGANVVATEAVVAAGPGASDFRIEVANNDPGAGDLIIASASISLEVVEG